MQIKNEFPPNIEKIREHFNIPKNAVFTHGDTIYVPSGKSMDEPLKAHEAVHSQQQGDNPDGWWDRYFSDKSFRLEQELKAYQAQYIASKRILKDRERLHRFLHNIAVDLSSEMYGNIISYAEAMKKIKS